MTTTAAADATAAADVPSLDNHHHRIRVAGAMLLAAVLFGLCNTAWRFGEGSVLAIAATRAAAGLILFAPMATRVSRSGALRRVASDPAAVAACVLGGATLWCAALLLRTVPGPVAAAAIGMLPVVTLAVGRMVGSRRTPVRAVAAMGVATIAALVAAGPVTLSWALVAPLTLFLCAESASLLTAEAARRRHDASTLVVGGLIVGALPAPFLWAGPGLALSGVGAAIAVALFGTTGRLLRSHAQASVSAAVAGSSAQVTALVTAFGGVLLFADALGPARVVALTAGAVAAALAVWWSAPSEASSAAAAPRAAQE